MYLRYRSHLEIEPRRVAFGVRLLGYVALWILAASAFTVTTAIGSVADTGHSEWFNRTLVFLYTPVLASMGLAGAFTSPNAAPVSFAIGAAFFYFLHGALTLACTRVGLFVFLCLLHLCALAASVFFMARLSQALLTGAP